MQLLGASENISSAEQSIGTELTVEVNERWIAEAPLHKHWRHLDRARTENLG
jgi:hypothetical protein